MARSPRLAMLRARLHSVGLDLLRVSTPSKIRYLSGFSGSLAYLLLRTETAEILGDSRYRAQMEQEATGFTLARSGLASACSDLGANASRPRVLGGLDSRLG